MKCFLIIQLLWFKMRNLNGLIYLRHSLIKIIKDA
jgi:hypothetical protein